MPRHFSNNGISKETSTTQHASQFGQQKIGANYTPVSIFLTVFAEAPW